MASVRQAVGVGDEVVLGGRNGIEGSVQAAVWLSGKEAAEHIGVSWPTLRQVILDHAIPHVRLGRRWKIEASVLDAHLRRLASNRAGRA
jgi:excisionase family DNA binding protein